MKKRWYRNMTPKKHEQIRDQYFKQRLKQTEIAKLHKISQGSVSRIISA